MSLDARSARSCGQVSSRWRGGKHAFHFWLSVNADDSAHAVRGRSKEIAPSRKWRAALSVAYGAGLRGAEVCNLEVADIDGAQIAQMRLRVVMGKRRKDGLKLLGDDRLARISA